MGHTRMELILLLVFAAVVVGGMVLIGLVNGW
jgi:hypothetical protein